MRRFLLLGACLLGGLVNGHACMDRGTDVSELKKAYENLAGDGSSKSNQEKFFNQFPDNWIDFLALYDLPSEGYSYGALYNQSSEYISAFENLDKISKVDYVQRLIDLTYGSYWRADAACYLKGVIHRAMKENRGLFFSQLSKEDKAALMDFWAFYWSNPTDNGTNNKAILELESMKKEMEKKYPEVVRAMAIGYEYYHGHIYPGK